jgi:DNA-binding transcriptional MerR regulator
MIKETETKNRTPVFNIKAVVTQTGLNPATIRAWERRYGFPRPHRTMGGHRQYSQRDIDTLKWLISRQEEGMSISHAIELWRSSVKSGDDPLQRRVLSAPETTTRLATQVKGERIAELRQSWISACLAFDKSRAEQVLARAFALFSPEIVCIELLQKGLAKVGAGWYRGDVTVQQEHFISALSIQRLEMLISSAPPPTHMERIIILTTPGDYHIFSPLLLTYLLRRGGWDVIYLGANVPASELESMIKQVKPALLIATAQLLHTAANLLEIAQSLKPHGVRLAYGGLVFNHMPALRNLLPGYYLGKSIEGASERVSSLLLNQLPAHRPEQISDIYEQALTQYMERRALIESHVWGTYSAANKPSEHLAAVNIDISQTVEAALKLGDIGLLSKDITWIEHLLMGYRLPKEWVLEYLLAYYQAAKIHLDEPASMIVDWLSQLVAAQDDLLVQDFLKER